MTFYKTLTPYYDQIFPANEKTVHFLSSHFNKGSHLLDVGAGTGNMALALVNNGYKVTATEPEEMMTTEIRKKAEAVSDQLKILNTPMQQINELTDHFDGIYCIGNTLAHLNNLDEIKQFFQHVQSKLNKNGLFIMQIVNFEKVLSKEDFSFPKIEKETFEFERQYDLDDGKILFTTTLTVDDQSISNTLPLYPATAKELLPLFKDCGFKEVHAYGNYLSASYSIDSPALIIVAKI